MRTKAILPILASAAILAASAQSSAQVDDAPGVITVMQPLSTKTTASSKLPSGIISTVAGTGRYGSSGNGALAKDAELADPSAVAVDSRGNLYIADQGSNTVRKVSALTGIIDIYAGTGVGGYSGDGGPAADAQLYLPVALAIDSKNDLYIADSGNSVIRRVDAETGKISTVAGNGLQISPITGLDDCGPMPDGGLATRSSICYPTAVTVDAKDDLYIADQASFVYRVDGKSHDMTIFAGNGNRGFSGDGGPATDAQISQVGGLAVDSAGNLLLGDTGNCTIRRINAATHVITSLINTDPQSI
jgi:streptogramin lyase